MMLYVARHGETAWNRAGRYQGQLESELTQTGREQARALAHTLAGHAFAAIYASPLARCRDTAQALSDACGVPVRLDDRLIEIAHGTWEGRLREAIEREEPELYAQWRTHPERVAFPGGESLADVAGRWQAFLGGLHDAGDVAVVTHDVLVRIAILAASSRGIERLWEPRVVNGGYARLEWQEGRTTLHDECIDAHLEGILVEPARQAL